MKQSGVTMMRVFVKNHVVLNAVMRYIIRKVHVFSHDVHTNNYIMAEDREGHFL